MHTTGLEHIEQRAHVAAEQDVIRHAAGAWHGGRVHHRITAIEHVDGLAERFQVDQAKPCAGRVCRHAIADQHIMPGSDQRRDDRLANVARSSSDRNTHRETSG